MSSTHGSASSLDVLQPAYHGLVFPPGPVLIHQQTEAFLEAQARHLRIFHLLAIRIGHSDEAQGVQFLHRLVIQHQPTSCAGLVPSA